MDASEQLLWVRKVSVPSACSCIDIYVYIFDQSKIQLTALQVSARPYFELPQSSWQDQDIFIVAMVHLMTCRGRRTAHVSASARTVFTRYSGGGKSAGIPLDTLKLGENIDETLSVPHRSCH